MTRHVCEQCLKAKAACICDWISPVNNQTRIVILQHPDETKKPLGTAKIATLCLDNVELWVGVDFSNVPYFNELVTDFKHCAAVLYPAELATDLNDWTCNDSLINNLNNDNCSKTLIVLDGTWRNTREIMLSNKPLQDLLKVKLKPSKHSDYRIRKAPMVESLSTVEAISLSLSILEPETRVDPMLNCFKEMIDYQIECMGEEVYRKNYLDKADK